MNVRFTRRAALAGAAAFFQIARSGWSRGASTSASAVANDRLADLEKRSGGRLGVAVLDTSSGKRLQHRADERFALCSTFKFLAAAAVLERVDRGRERLDRWINYRESDLLEYAPVTREHVKEGRMMLSDLCAAAVEMSDNTAANLILPLIGGPAGLTRYCRSLGDRITRLDRTEPTLNRVPAGEVRDTTTPAAMLKLMNTILCGEALSPASLQQLETWLIEAKVGRQRIPCGLPPHWRIGHKTGTGPDGETNDVGIVWPPDRAPILVAGYFTGSPAPQAEREAVLCEVGRIVAENFR
jgi:beta-lactamase class A